MPAFNRRRIFASPFVVTIAAAACNAPDASPPPREPTTTPSATATASATASATATATATATASATASASATPTASAAPQTPRDRRWSIDKGSKGCVAYSEVDCPPTMDCNPPPPQEYACPPGVTSFPVNVVKTPGATTCVTTSTPAVKVPCPK